MIIKCKKCGKEQGSTATKNRDVFILVRDRKKHIFYCKKCADNTLLKPTKGYGLELLR